MSFQNKYNYFKEALLQAFSGKVANFNKMSDEALIEFIKEYYN